MSLSSENSSVSPSFSRAEQRYNQALELEKQLRVVVQAKGPFDSHARALRNNIRECYEAVVLEDHEFAEVHEVEQAIWRLHYKQIDEFRAKIKKNSSIAAAGPAVPIPGGKSASKQELMHKILAAFKSFLGEATGFYHNLILKLRAKHDLPQDYLAFEVTSDDDEKRAAEVKRCESSCHRCLIFLGDLARYKEVHGDGQDWSVSAGYYLQASALWPSSGNPHNQLAVLATYVGDELLAVYRYCRSLAVKSPFLTSRDNLVLLFEKNRQQSAAKTETGRPGQISELPKASEDKKSDKGDWKYILGTGEVKHAIKEWKFEDTGSDANSAFNVDLRKQFRMHFVRLNGILFTRTSLETFTDVHMTAMRELEQLLAGEDASLEAGLVADCSRTGMTNSGAADILQLVTILIFAVFNANSGTEVQNQTYAEVLQRSSLLRYAFSAAFECAGRLMRRCGKFREPASSPFLPGMLIFLEWLACQPEMAIRSEVDEKQANARTFFWKQCVNLLNLLVEFASSEGAQPLDSLQHHMDDGAKGLALWEDYELRGFLPLLPAQSALDFSNRRPRIGTWDKKEVKVRVHRFLSAGKAVAKALQSNGKDVVYDLKEQKFYIAGEMHSGIDTSLSTIVTSSAQTTESSTLETPITLSLKIPSVVVSKKEEEDEEVIVFQPLSKDREAASVAAEIFLQPTLLPANGYGNPSDSEVSHREAAASLPDFQGMIPLSASQWSSLSRIVDAAAPAYSHPDAGDWVLGNRSRVTNGVEKTTSTAGVLGHPKQTAISSSLWSSQLEALATNNLLPNLQLGSLSLNSGWGAERKTELPAISQPQASETAVFPGIISPPNPTRVGPPAMRPPPGFGPLPANRVGSPAPPGPIKVSMNVRRSNDFFAAGGGKGVYKAPLRGYVHAGHPVPLELRPHPLKDTNLSTKAIVCTETSVWAASDTHLQVWDIESATRECSAAVNNLTGDEDAAAYHVLPVHGEPISCLAMDAANHIVWSGHRDGKVQGWPMQVETEKPMTTTVPILMWEAHQSPVTAIAVSSYGELWVGSESGLINVWPCEATSGGLVHGQEDEMIAALFFARLCMPLRGLITGNNPSQTELYFLVAEHSAGRIWAGGILYITLWDARTREAMRVFGASVYSEPIVPNLGLPQGTEIPTDERASRRESGFGGWFQLSKSVFSGAADAIRRAADRSGFISEESRKLEALVASTDGTVWGAVGSATLVQWNQEGDRMQEVPVVAAPVKCLLVVGSRLWAGCTNGKVQVLSSKTGKLLGSWGGHQTAVLQMERGGSYVFTLAANGGIRGWHVASLSPLDSLLQTELSSRTSTFTQQRQLRVFAGTWNVAQGKASMQSLQAWLAGPAKHAGLMFVGLQEMEMGAGAIGMAAVKETVGGFVNRGSANGQWWLDSIGAAIGDGKEFERVGSRQLAGLLIGAWVRKHLRPHVGDVDAGAVACGFGRTFGNKGAVGVRMMIFRRTICVLNSHFAAHQGKVASRNSDFDYVYNNMTFGHKPGAVTSAAAGIINSPSYEAEGTEEVTSPDLSDADILLWFGDFNYRIDASYEQALSLIEKKCYDVLLLKDQLRNEMSSGRTFHGMREGFVGFAPTYKFDHGSQAYDTSEKKRVPAYCDRVVFRDSFDGNDVVQASKLSHPAKVSVAAYEACMEVTDSDHKPVRCLFNVDLAVVDEAARRRQFGDIMDNNAGVRACLERCNIVPHTIVNTNKVILEENSSSILEVSNESQAAIATFTVHCEGEPSGQGCPCGTHTSSPKGPSHRGGYGFPRWLQVRPAAGMIGPQESVSIKIQHSGLGPFTQYTNSEASMDGQPSWWRDDQNGKVVVLVVTVRGPLTAAFEQHRLCICKLPFSGSQ
ncbi:unnamed protein product [Sphagnum compactum]